LPLYEPLQPAQAVNLPGGSEDTVRGSYNQRYHSALAQQAKEQYETWLHKKRERENGIAEESESYGTRDWVPRTRIVARPGEVEGIAHSEGYGDPSLRPQSTAPPPALHAPATEPQQNPWNPYGYPFILQQFPTDPYGIMTGAAYEQNDPISMTNRANVNPQALNQDSMQQGYWDPSDYWWCMGMGMPEGFYPNAEQQEWQDPSLDTSAKDEKQS
jgi:hypothetical protein